MTKCFVEEAESDFRSRKLRVNLPEVRLVQCTANHPRIFTGAGTIWQQPDGGTKLSFFPREDLPPLGPDAALFNPLQPKMTTGQLIPRRAFFSMTAHDSRGLVWKSKGILLDVEFSRKPRVITANLHEIRAYDEEYASSQIYLEFESYNPIEFPCNSGSSTEIKNGTVASPRPQRWMHPWSKPAVFDLFLRRARIRSLPRLLIHRIGQSIE